MECPITVQSKSCDGGLAAIDGTCQYCGEAGLPECPFFFKVPSCNDGLKAMSGKCVALACGFSGQPACSSLESPCEAGLTQINGTCTVVDAFTKLREKAEADQRKYFPNILGALKLVLEDLGTNALQNGIATGPAYNPVPDLAAMGAYSDLVAIDFPVFKTLTLGVSVAATTVAVEGRTDSGFAIGIRKNEPNPIYWYAGASYKLNIGLSGAGGINVGLWLPANNQIAGNIDGVTVGLDVLVSSVAKDINDFREGVNGIRELIKAMKTRDSVAPSFDLVVTMWYTQGDNPELRGITATPALMVGGAVYSDPISRGLIAQVVERAAVVPVETTRGTQLSAADEALQAPIETAAPLTDNQPEPVPYSVPAAAAAPGSQLVFRNYWKQDQVIAARDGSAVSGLAADYGEASRWIAEPVVGADGYVRLRNAAAGDSFLNIEYGPIAAGHAEMGWYSAMWTIEHIPGTNQARIRNRWQPDSFLNVENGQLGAGPIQPGWQSAIWFVE
jgi:hypothetical protein